MKSPALGVTLALSLTALAPGCGQGPDSPRFPDPPGLDPMLFDGARAMGGVEALVEIGPRPAGSDGAAKAASFLKARFEEYGLETTLDEFEEDTPLGPVVFRNVVARLPGSGGETIVLGSHYDTKRGIGTGFVGANDSGSSTGVLLELARAVREAVPSGLLGADLVFVAFDGEECAVRYGPRDGFHGSRRFVRRLKESGGVDLVRAMILMDMVGDRDLRVTIPANGTPWLRRLALDAAEDMGVRQQFGLFPGAIGDDHVAFLEAGIPAIDLIDFTFGSAPGRNDYWHTEEDTLDKLSPESLETVGRVVLRMVDRLLVDGAPTPSR